MGMYEKHAPVIHRDGLTASELLLVQELDALANSSVGQFLRKESGSIVNATLSEIIALSGLSDVLISTPSSGQVLSYNGSSWVNADPTGGGGSGSGTVTSVSVVTANGVSGSVANATTDRKSVV